MKKLLLAAAIACGFCSAADAGMTGDTVTMHYEYPTLNSGYYDGGSAIVSSGVEFIGLNVGLWANANFTDTQLILSFTFSHAWSAASQNGPVFVDTSHAFKTVSVDPSTSSTWFNSSMVSIVNDVLIVNWQGQSFTNGQNIVLNLTTDLVEPASLAMLGIGLAGLGVVRRKRG